MISVQKILEVNHKLYGYIKTTPLQENENLSAKYGCKVLLKREDLQLGRSYKLRGAFNKISSLSEEERLRGVVCASAGNHAQGVALSCAKLQIKGTIFMPKTAPLQKVDKVRQFGKEFIEIILIGDTFDDAFAEARLHEAESGKVFIPPFDDEKIVEGQGTVGKEIYEQESGQIDYLFVPIGGGGLASGVGSYFKQVSPDTKVIGVEPMGAASMKLSFEKGKITRLQTMDKFVDGAAVAQVGKLNFEICKEVLSDIVTVEEGRTCTIILRMYNDDAIVLEPSGALSIGALENYKEEIKGKTVVCIISGGNNDITRMEEIKERSMLFEGLKHYFIINFPRRAGSFKEFVNNVLGSNDEISLIQYSSKKNSGDTVPAMIGLELKDKEAILQIKKKLEERGFSYELLNENPMLFDYLVK
ncbi:MAG: threonine ammonia-lyase IlvA [Chitinophagales bacterium]|nr:threonine ammonia-lyase IlvA [Chitinophagales bacterium]